MPQEREWFSWPQTVLPPPSWLGHTAERWGCGGAGSRGLVGLAGHLRESRGISPLAGLGVSASRGVCGPGVVHSEKTQVREGYLKLGLNSPQQRPGQGKGTCRVI